MRQAFLRADCVYVPGPLLTGPWASPRPLPAWVCHLSAEHSINYPLQRAAGTLSEIVIEPGTRWVFNRCKLSFPPCSSLAYPISCLAGRGGEWGSVPWSEEAEVSLGAGWCCLLVLRGGWLRALCSVPWSPGGAALERGWKKDSQGGLGPWPGLRALSEPVLPRIFGDGESPPSPQVSLAPVQAWGHLPWPSLSPAALSKFHTKSQGRHHFPRISRNVSSRVSSGLSGGRKMTS